MPRLVSMRLFVVCALAVLFSASTAAIAAAKVPVSLRVVGGGGKVLAEESLKTGTTSVPTSAKATCFGKGTGGSGKAVKIKGATALGLLGQAAKSTAALKPLLLTELPLTTDRMYAGESIPLGQLPGWLGAPIWSQHSK